MTKPEFIREFDRLCAGFKYQATPVQVAAFYERLRTYESSAWKEAVTDLVCAPSFPHHLDKILQAVDRREEQHRRAKADRERMQAEQYGVIPDGHGMPEEVRQWFIAQGLLVEKRGRAIRA